MTKTKILGIGIYTGFLMAIAASVTGTLAWYSYSSLSGVNYEGTAIGNGEALEVGLYTDRRLPSECVKYDLIEDTNYPCSNFNHYVYWTHSNLDPVILNYFLINQGSATNSLTAITSGAYSPGDTISFKESLAYLDNTQVPAGNFSRVSLPLTFRSRYLTSEGQIAYADNKHVFLTLADIYTEDFGANGYIYKAARLFLQNGNGNSYLINPSELNDGYTEVGGVLNLDSHGKHYDYTFDFDGTKKEYPYGEFENTPVWEDHVNEEEEPTLDTYTTFDAVHKKGVKKLDLEASKPKRQYYLGKEKFVNKDECVAITSPETNHLAVLNIDLWLEGWDHSVIDQEISHQFKLDLEFQVD